MTALLSNSIHSLIDHLAQRIAMEEEIWILLPGTVNKQWLSIELVKRLPRQALCGVRFLSWKEALRSLPGFFEAGCAFAAAEWFGNQKNNLIWRLAHRVQDALLYGVQSAHEWQKELLGSLGSTEKQKTERIFCFCLEELSDGAWEFLLREKAEFFFFSPCRMFWEDLYTDGQRAFIQTKMQMHDASLDDTHPLLANWGKLARTALKKAEPLQIDEAYEEIEGPSLLQQIQRDLLDLRTLEDEGVRMDLDDSVQIIAAGSSKLNEVRILKEKISQLVLDEGVPYSEILVLAPDIAVYEPAIQFIFGNEMPVRIGPLPAFSPLGQAVHLFLHLEWDADDLLELFEQVPFQKKQGIEQEDLRWFRIWMREALVRGGWENLVEGMERMRRGLIYLLPQEEGPLRIETIDWGQAESLQLFFSCVRLVKKHLDAMQESRTLREWGETLRAAVRELFDAEETLSFLQRLFSASLQFREEKFTFAFIQSAFKEVCESSKEMKGSLLVDAIDFLSLQPGAVRPARALFLLGADSEQLPRHDELSAFDWKTKQVDRADRDRSLLLQMLFAAKEKLFVSYCHISSEDGQPVDLAHPIQELVQLLERFYGVKPEKRVFPLISVRMDQKKTCPSEPQEPIKRWDFADLLFLMRDPWSYFLKHSQGVYLKKDKLFAELSFKECEPFLTIKNFDARKLPEGPFGVLAEEKMKAQLALWRKNFSSWGETISVEVRLDSGVEIVGQIEMAKPGELFIPGDLNFLSLLRNWPALLAVATLSSEPPTIHSLKSGKSKVFEGLDAKKELDLLIRYALRARESFSPLILSWAEAFLKEEPCRESEEEVFQWVADRFSLPDFTAWRPFLREVFHAIL